MQPASMTITAALAHSSTHNNTEYNRDNMDRQPSTNQLQHAIKVSMALEPSLGRCWASLGISGHPRIMKNFAEPGKLIIADCTVGHSVLM